VTVELLTVLLLKATALAAVGLTVQCFLTKRAADRANVLRLTVCLILAAPLTLLVNFGPLSLVWEEGLQGREAVAPLLIGAELRNGVAWTVHAGYALGAIWLAGTVVLLGRIGWGLFRLRVWTGAAGIVECAVWRTALDRHAPPRRPLLRVSDRIQGPLSWGALPGVILLDPASLLAADRADAVLAHEVAHLARADWIFLMLSHLARAAFWPSPLVWRLHTGLGLKTEEAADAVAITRVDRHAYAYALVSTAAAPSPFGATAMIPNNRLLRHRIEHVLQASTEIRPQRLAHFACCATMAAAGLGAWALQVQSSADQAAGAPAA